jgi:hypothetical protein
MQLQLENLSLFRKPADSSEAGDYDDLVKTKTFEANATIRILAEFVAAAIDSRAYELTIEYQDDQECIFAQKNGRGFGIARLPSASEEARKLRQEIYRIVKQPTVIKVLDQEYLLEARGINSSREPVFHVVIKSC